MRLSELALFTDDVQAAAQFYERLLGTGPVHRGEGIAVFEVAGVQVLIHERCAAGPDDPPCEDHVAFAVGDVDRAAAEGEARGLTVDFPPRDYDWGRSAYLRDPDGRLLELHEQRNGQ